MSTIDIAIAEKLNYRDELLPRIRDKEHLEECKTIAHNIAWKYPHDYPTPGGRHHCSDRQCPIGHPEKSTCCLHCMQNHPTMAAECEKPCGGARALAEHPEDIPITL